jgi:hypothetical protein
MELMAYTGQPEGDYPTDDAMMLRKLSWPASQRQAGEGSEIGPLANEADF